MKIKVQPAKLQRHMVTPITCMVTRFTNIYMIYTITVKVR